MEFLARLNRRHKVALFLTLVAAGVMLVLGASAKQTAGAVLLGLAFAWAFGSNSRIVHWLFVGLGSALLLGPVGFDRYSLHQAGKDYADEIAAFEHRIPELAKEYPYKKVAIDPQTGEKTGWNGSMWVVLSPGSSNHKIGDEPDGDRWIPETDTRPLLPLPGNHSSRRQTTT